jgi:hypothetical protein
MKGLRALLSGCFIAGSLAASAQEGSPPLPSIGESAHFRFATASADTTALGKEFDEIFNVVLRRLGVSLDKKVTVAIVPPAPGSCGSRGSTMVARVLSAALHEPA